MTVSSTVARARYVGNDVADTFAYPFRIIDQAHLQVTEIDTAGVETVLVLGVDYTVTNVRFAAGGNVVLTAGPLTMNYILVIERVVPMTQLRNLRTQGAFLPETHEDALDLLTMAVQQLEQILSTLDPSLARALLLSVGDVVGSGSYDALSNRIKNVDDPTDAQDAVTKTYADNLNPRIGTAVYTLATRPAADTLQNQFIKIKDAGLPEELQYSAEGFDGTYEWQTVVTGKAW